MSEEQSIPQIQTIAELADFAHNHQIPVVCQLIQRAIWFFERDCLKDKNAIRARRDMGLRFRLTNEHALTPQILDALRNWMMFHGRDIGTDYLRVVRTQVES